MGEAKRILILTADAGFGHRSAANAIAAALPKSQPGRALVDIANPMDDPRVPPPVRRSQQDYDRMVRQAPRLYRLGYYASDKPVPNAIVESALTVLLFEVLRETLKRFQPDAIVTTYPLYAPPLAAVFVAQRKAVPLLVVVTDLVNVHRIWFHKSADWCLVPTAAVRAQALKAGLPSPKVRITGIPVNPELSADSRTQAAIRSHLGLQPDRMTVLAVGSRRVRSLMDNLHVLNHSGLPIQIAAVAGGDSDLYAELQETQWHIPVQVYGYVKDMVPLILAADLVLCKAGGLAVTEALAAGRPLLLVDVLPGQEEGNAAHVVEGGAGELSRKPTETLEILCHWLAQGGALLGLRAERSRALGRPQAALEVAEIAWQAAVEGPELRPRGRGPSRARIEKLLRQHGIRWQEGPAESDPRAGA